MFILVHGNPIEGFTFIGPFDEKDRYNVANRAEHALGGDYWIADLINTDPDGIDKYLLKQRKEKA